LDDPQHFLFHFFNGTVFFRYRHPTLLDGLADCHIHAQGAHHFPQRVTFSFTD